MSMSIKHLNNKLVEDSKQLRWSPSNYFPGTKLEFPDNQSRKHQKGKGGLEIDVVVTSNI